MAHKKCIGHLDCRQRPSFEKPWPAVMPLFTRKITAGAGRMAEITECHGIPYATSISHQWLLLSRLFGNCEEWIGTFVVLECSQRAVVMRQLRLAAQQRLVLVHFLLHLRNSYNIKINIFYFNNENMTI